MLMLFTLIVAGFLGFLVIRFRMFAFLLSLLGLRVPVYVGSTQLRWARVLFLLKYKEFVCFRLLAKEMCLLSGEATFEKIAFLPLSRRADLAVIQKEGEKMTLSIRYLEPIESSEMECSLDGKVLCVKKPEPLFLTKLLVESLLALLWQQLEQKGVVLTLPSRSDRLEFFRAMACLVPMAIELHRFIKEVDKATAEEASWLSQALVGKMLPSSYARYVGWKVLSVRIYPYTDQVPKMCVTFQDATGARHDLHIETRGTAIHRLVKYAWDGKELEPMESFARDESWEPNLVNVLSLAQAESVIKSIQDEAFLSLIRDPLKKLFPKVNELGFEPTTFIIGIERFNQASGQALRSRYPMAPRMRVTLSGEPSWENVSSKLEIIIDVYAVNRKEYVFFACAHTDDARTITDPLNVAPTYCLFGVSMETREVIWPSAYMEPRVYVIFQATAKIKDTAEASEKLARLKTKLDDLGFVLFFGDTVTNEETRVRLVIDFWGMFGCTCYEIECMVAREFATEGTVSAFLPA